MNERAERNETKSRIAGIVVLVEIGDLARPARRPGVGIFAIVALVAAVADRRGHRQNRGRRERRAEYHEFELGAAGKLARRPQQRIADDAAESGRQRPAAGRGRQRSGAGAAGE